MRRAALSLVLFCASFPLLPSSTTLLAQDSATIPTISWKDAGNYVDKEVNVVGRIVRATRGRSGQYYLNFVENWKGTLSIYIPRNAAARFDPNPEDLFKGKTIKVRGLIYLFKENNTDELNLKVEDPKAIVIVPGDSSSAGEPEATAHPSNGSSSPNTPASASSSQAVRAEEYLPTIGVAHAGDFLEQEVFVIGKIGGSRQVAAGHLNLDLQDEQGHTLKVFIRRKYLPNFPASPAQLYAGKVVRIRGRLYLFENKPDLPITHPGQVRVLPDDAKPPTEPQWPIRIKPAMSAAPGAEITVGSYNLLNLFDDVDDPYYADDILDAKPRHELEALATSIRKLNADVLAVAEVENRGILETFARRFLPDMGYEPVLIEGNDDRGIDVGVLSRLPVGRVISHRHLRFKDADGKVSRFRRDLLQVRIEPPGGTPFDVFVVHLKSKGGVEEGGIETRTAEAREIRRILDDLLKRESQALFVLCGDFNDTLDSEPLMSILGKGATQLASFVNDLPPDNRVTFNQTPHLSMIDFILASPGMAGRYVAKSYGILPGSPETSGSDHNPVFARFRVGRPR
ncbi:MAG TPA: endonuclease/exonuclease/phosphatase family protein [Phycisphaerae bacterium]|nr:endonuclease/exonuclease/phosphatase family protein [Phycisphaerae bacterium]HRY70817.1 endonuclease/exonuclease/phosphatase family protein [Phycisphaerae bacterium]HSA28322.1 endonuclease/exonuclease/phosphatase family protein [Phycisphaerae bacterium]